MTIRAARIAALLLLAALVLVTLAPAGWRPNTPLPAQAERAIALLVVGFVFALAWPRHIWIVAIIVLGGTIALEVLQLVTPSRHGRLLDLAMKLAGGTAGLALGYVVGHRQQTRPPKDS